MVDYLQTILRIRDVYPRSKFFPSRIPDPNYLYPGCRILDAGCRIPDPGCRIPDARSRMPDPGSALKNFSLYGNLKKIVSKLSENFDPGCLSHV
jgi:hypothetical protein